MPSLGNVTQLSYDGRDIYVVGTAHVSLQSVDEVRRVIDELRPDTVCVELDKTRHESMVDPSRWRKLDIFQVIKQKKVLMLMASLALSAYQRRIGDKLGVKPGAEMLAACEKASEINAELVLADRDIQATLKRTWAALSLLSKAKVMGVLIAAMGGSGEELTEERIEQLKQHDMLNEALTELASFLPQLKSPLIDERDQYLMSSIREAPGKKIVAVVGAAHVQGMIKYLNSEVDRDQLSVIPPPSLFVRALKWVIPLIVLGAFYYGYVNHESATFERMLYAWILPNAILAAVFATVAGAKLLTIVSVAIASPITSLNPTIGAGIVGGLIEAWLRKPTVGDCESVPEDSVTIRGIYRNRFTRVLLVAVLSTIGSALGGYIGAGWVVTYL